MLAHTKMVIKTNFLWILLNLHDSSVQLACCMEGPVPKKIRRHNRKLPVFRILSGTDFIWSSDLDLFIVLVITKLLQF